MTIHVVGAGMAGLAAALRFARSGRHVVLHEQTSIAGGRCRTLHNPDFSRALDNGIHLHLAGQRHLHAFLAEIGRPWSLTAPARAACDFVDIDNGRRWTLHPSAGALPAWLLKPWRAVPELIVATILYAIPGVRTADFRHLWTMARAGPAETVAQIMPKSGLGRRYFWEPLCIGALNTEPTAASAQALWQMVRTVLASEDIALRVRLVSNDLWTDLVDPALRAFAMPNCELHLGSRLRAIEFDGPRVAALDFSDGRKVLAAEDRVILAVPATAATELIPGLTGPVGTRAMVTAHFALPSAGSVDPVLTTIIDSRPVWLLTRDAVATVTVGAADDLLDVPDIELARRLWSLVARALGHPGALPDWHVLKVANGTHAHTPEEEARRPPAQTRWRNLLLAGDWTRTGQAACVDGAIQSGFAAADAVLLGEAAGKLANVADRP